MEQLQNHEPPTLNEERIEKFCDFLRRINTVDELFDDGEFGGDREPRIPMPEPPSSSSASSRHEQLAPVYELFPNNPLPEQNKVMLKVLVNS
jgi:hypothetical protein